MRCVLRFAVWEQRGSVLSHIHRYIEGESESEEGREEKGERDR